MNAWAEPPENISGFGTTVDGPAAATGGPQTILLVDDESLVRTITRQLLEKAGYNVLEAQGADEAWQILCENHRAIDLLLTDFTMPETNGAQLAAQAHAAYPCLRTIIMSGHAEHPTLQELLLNMAVRYLEKPFTIAKLLSRVAEALQDGREQRESNYPNESNFDSASASASLPITAI